MGEPIVISFAGEQSIGIHRVDFSCGYCERFVAYVPYCGGFSLGAPSGRPAMKSTTSIRGGDLVVYRSKRLDELH